MDEDAIEQHSLDEAVLEQMRQQSAQDANAQADAQIEAALAQSRQEFAQSAGGGGGGGSDDELRRLGILQECTQDPWGDEPWGDNPEEEALQRAMMASLGSS